MLLFNFEGQVIEQIPKKVFRGIDYFKFPNGFSFDLYELFNKGKISSNAGLIQEGLFDFKKFYSHRTKNDVPKSLINYYLRMQKEEKLDIKSINHNLRIHHELHYPTPLISTSFSLIQAVRYSHWIEMPVLVFSTNNLEGISFGDNSPNKEIGIFKEIRIENLTDIILFYEDKKKIKSILKKFNREDIILHQGFIKENYRYKDIDGNFYFDVPENLLYDPEVKSFYQNKEQEIIRRI
jgi:hypothetical protein